MSEASVPTLRKRPVATVVWIAVVVLLGVGYALHERNQSRQNAEQKAQFTAALRQMQAEVAALTTRLQSISQPQAQTPATVVVHAQARRPAAARKVDDPRWKQFQSQLEQQTRAIESARNDLTSARTELSGSIARTHESIARTHEELVMLQKRGERNFYEFDLDKSKQFARSGALGISLRKANVKKQYADLELMVDDVKLTRKHVNLYEPVLFYTSEAAQPAELVINNISKDHIRGYVSEPRFRKSDMATLSNTAQQAAGVTPSPAAEQRKKLNVPQ